MKSKLFPAGLVFLLGCSLFVPGVALSADKIGLTVTPRIWFTTADFNTSSSAFEQDGFESVSVPLYGATFAYKPKNHPVEYSFTFLTGSGSARYAFTDLSETGNFDNDRLDLEFLARYLVPNSNISLFGGFRLVSYDTDIRLDFGGTFSATGTSSFITEVDIFLIELGVGVFSNITENGKHRLFANLTAGFGSVDQEFTNPLPGQGFSESDGTIAVDTNFGYSYVFNQSSSAHFRYRFFTLSLPSTITVVSVANDWVVFHGPEIGYTHRF